MTDREELHTEEEPSYLRKEIMDMTDEEIDAYVWHLWEDARDHPEHWVSAEPWHDRRLPIREEGGPFSSELLALNYNDRDLSPVDYLRDLACRLAQTYSCLKPGYIPEPAYYEGKEITEPSFMSLDLREFGGHPEYGRSLTPAELDGLDVADGQEAFRRRFYQTLDAVELCEGVASLTADADGPEDKVPRLLFLPRRLAAEVERYARRCERPQDELVSLAVSQWLEEPFQPREHEISISLSLGGYERTVLHNKASALGLTLGEYVQRLLDAIAVIGRESFDDRPITAEGFDQAFDDGWDVLPYCVVTNEGDRQVAARELVDLLCSPHAHADSDDSVEMLRALTKRIEPDHDAVAMSPIVDVDE